MERWEELSLMGMNTCDKCGAEKVSEDLVWISAEDFKPFDGETVPDEVYAKYTALCEPCYRTIINTQPNEVR